MRYLGLLLGLLLLRAAPAFSQPSEAEIAHAKRIFEEAQVHYQLQEYEAALTGYKEVYRILQSPSVLFNLGQCYRLLGRYSEARRAYEQFLAAVPDTPHRAEVEGFIAEVKEKEAQAAPATGPAVAAPALAPPGPAEEASLPRRLLLPGGLALSGAAFGIGALLVKSGRGEVDGVIIEPASTRRLLLGLSLASDLSFLSSGATLLLALRDRRAAPEPEVTP